MRIAMQCPRCASTHNRKNGWQRGKQNYICVQCGRQFIDCYEPKGYSEDFKRECLEMYVNGSGFRAIERVKTDDVAQLIHMLCSQIDKCLIPLVAQV